MLCYKCLKTIEKTEPKRLLPIDNPYVNIFFHKDCFNTMFKNGYGEAIYYFSQNGDRIFDYIEKIKESKQKKR